MGRCVHKVVVYLVAMSAVGALAQTPATYRNNFEGCDVGKPPKDMLVLDGAFAVRDHGTNRVLELPGAPLESYGILFGSAVKESWEVSARIYTTSQGRRYSTFAVGLGGAAGHRFQVTPAKKQVELFRGDTQQKAVPWNWSPAHWTRLRLQILPAAGGGWTVRAKAWQDGETEPAQWLIEFRDAAEPKSGRAAVYGSPFSGIPIDYDDLEVRPVQ